MQDPHDESSVPVAPAFVLPPSPPIEVYGPVEEREDYHALGTLCCFSCSWRSNLRLKHFRELPDWLKDNDFVQSCYRHHNLSVAEAFKSIFQLHCETVNIWTHLLAAILTVIAAWAVVAIYPSLQDRIVLSIYFVGCFAVYTFSFLFHTLHVCSPLSLSVTGKLDYTGIIVSIGCCQLSIGLIMFPCETERLVFALITCMFSFVGLFLVLAPSAQHPRFRSVRALAFSGFGLFGIIPISSFLIKQFHNPACWSSSTLSLTSQCSDIIAQLVSRSAWMGGSFLIGAMLYAQRIPERWWPGKFDILGHSHQIWHCAVIMGFVFFYTMLTLLLEHKVLLSPHCFAQ